MPWQADTLHIVRVMINDLDSSSYTYSDERLMQVIIVSARLVLAVADFTLDYTANIDTMKVEPDPTEGADRDDNLVNLAVLKAASLIEIGEAKDAAKRGISFRDENTSFDGRGAAVARLEILKMGGWKKAYENALIDYQMNRIGQIGAAVTGPFRTHAANVGLRPQQG